MWRTSSRAVSGVTCRHAPSVETGVQIIPPTTLSGPEAHIHLIVLTAAGIDMIG